MRTLQIDNPFDGLRYKKAASPGLDRLLHPTDKHHPFLQLCLPSLRRSHYYIISATTISSQPLLYHLSYILATMQYTAILLSLSAAAGLVNAATSSPGPASASYGSQGPVASAPTNQNDASQDNGDEGLAAPGFASQPIYVVFEAAWNSTTDKAVNDFINGVKSCQVSVLPYRAQPSGIVRLY